MRSHITSDCGRAVSPLADCLNTSHGDANSCQKQLIIHRRPACSARPARSPSVIVRRNNYVHVTCMQPYKSANVFCNPAEPRRLNCTVLSNSADGLIIRHLINFEFSISKGRKAKVTTAHSLLEVKCNNSIVDGSMNLKIGWNICHK